MPVLVLGALALIGVGLLLSRKAHAAEPDRPALPPHPTGYVDDPRPFVPPSAPVPVAPLAPAAAKQVPIEVAVAVRDMANNDATPEQLRHAAAIADKAGDLTQTAVVMRQTADAQDEVASAANVPESVARATQAVADGTATSVQLRQAATDARAAGLPKVAAMLDDRATFLETGKYAQGPTGDEQQKVADAVNAQAHGQATVAQLSEAARAAQQQGLPKTAQILAASAVAKRAGPPAVAPDRPTIKSGAKGAAVREAQSMLKSVGAYGGKVDGDYGPGTVAAVKAFQRGRMGPDGKTLGDDGKIGPATWWALYQEAGPTPPAPGPAPTPHGPSAVAVAPGALPWPPAARPEGPDLTNFNQVLTYAQHYRDRIMNASWAAAATAASEAALRLYHAIVQKLAEPPPGGSWTAASASQRMGEYRRALAQADAKAVEAVAAQGGGSTLSSQIAALRAPALQPGAAVAPDRPTIKSGAKGAAVREAQSMLKSVGAYGGKVDGDYGPGTVAAVKAFQRGRMGPDGKTLGDDGKIGPATWWALYQEAGPTPPVVAGEFPFPRSPWPDVTEAQWVRFVQSLAAQSPDQVTARGGLGAFLYDPRRLEALGLMCNLRVVQGVRMGDFTEPLTREKFLGSFPVQAAVLARDLRRMRVAVESAFADQIGVEHAGRVATLSGLLALANAAGPNMKNWLANDGDKGRFLNTTAAYCKATGIF